MAHIEHTTTVELWPRRKVQAVSGIGKSLLYSQMRTGLYPTAIKCGASARWISLEAEQMRDFVIARPDATKEERRAFVAALIAKRPKVTDLDIQTFEPRVAS